MALRCQMTIFRNVYSRRTFSGLTHVSQDGRPVMVDVSDKLLTKRSASARAEVFLPRHVADVVAPDVSMIPGDSPVKELMSKKGPIFSTASIAGVMGLKKTSEIIPFCHPLPIENADVQLRVVRGNSTASDAISKLRPEYLDNKKESNISKDGVVIVIDCTVSVTHKTGVEMEALTGVTTAALTVYDMCKALSHEIEIRNIHLLSKDGGKRKYKRSE